MREFRENRLGESLKGLNYFHPHFSELLTNLDEVLRRSCKISWQSVQSQP
jgi:hypothetical protein